MLLLLYLRTPYYCSYCISSLTWSDRQIVLLTPSRASSIILIHSRQIVAKHESTRQARASPLASSVPCARFPRRASLLRECPRERGMRPAQARACRHADRRLAGGTLTRGQTSRPWLGGCSPLGFSHVRTQRGNPSSLQLRLRSACERESETLVRVDWGVGSLLQIGGYYSPGGAGCVAPSGR